MSARQDRLTFFGVLIAVVIVVLGYLQLGQLYPVAGRDDGASGVVVEVEAGERVGDRSSAEGDGRP